MPQHVTVVDPDPAWSVKYEEEKEKLLAVLKENAIAIYHIGSTSVPGLAAKPVIDIMAAVRSLEAVDAQADDFLRLGYEYLGEFGIAGRRYLRRGGDERTHQVHIFHMDDWDNISRHLAFRDYMRTHENARAQYAQLKKELAQRFPYDIDSYCDGKDAFVKKLEAQALSCMDETWDRLYIAARRVQHARTISPFIEAGQVGAALLTKKGSIYTGVCIDTACTLGMCAERNAIANMITNGEHQIERLVAVMPDGKPGMPCGACREMMMQLDEAAGQIEILCDIDTKKTVQLKTLLPDWW